jgi:hypothetical protein
MKILSFYSEAARDTAQDVIHGYDSYPLGSIFVFSETSSRLRILDLDETTHVIDSTMNEILIFGTPLCTMESFQVNGTTVYNSMVHLSVTI